MTIDEADLKADMHRAIQAWFDCPLIKRPSAFALGERIRTIALNEHLAAEIAAEEAKQEALDGSQFGAGA